MTLIQTTKKAPVRTAKHITEALNLNPQQEEEAMSHTIRPTTAGTTPPLSPALKSLVDHWLFDAIIAGAAAHYPHRLAAALAAVRIPVDLADLLDAADTIARADDADMDAADWAGADR